MGQNEKKKAGLNNHKMKEGRKMENYFSMRKKGSLCFHLL